MKLLSKMAAKTLKHTGMEGCCGTNLIYKCQSMKQYWRSAWNTRGVDGVGGKHKGCECKKTQFKLKINRNSNKCDNNNDNMNTYT